MTQTYSATANFAEALQTMIRKELEENFRDTLPHLLPGNFIPARWVRGSDGTFRFLRIPDLDTSGDLTNGGTISAGTAPWLTEGTAPDAEALAFGYEEFSGGQAGRRVELTDIALEEHPVDLAAVAAERVAYNAKATIDEFVGRKLAAGTNVMYAGTGNADTTDLTSTDVLTGRLFRRARQTMRGDLIPTFAGGSYRALIHPDVVFDFEDDSDVGGWLSIGNYTSPDGILNGEIGKYANIRFIESANTRTFAAAAGDGSDVYSTTILGTMAYAVGDWGSVTSHVVMPGGHGDELAQVMSVGWKGRFGAFVVGEGDNATGASDPRYLRVESCSGI